MRWEIQQYTLCDGWANTWTVHHDDGRSEPETFASHREAQDALDEFLIEIDEEIEAGQRAPDEGFSDEEFRIVRVGTEVHEIEWQGIAITVGWCPDWMSMIAHLELRSRDRCPLPMTETGYRSHFIAREAVEERGGPVAYAIAWLDHEAGAKEWQAKVAASKQLSLF